MTISDLPQTRPRRETPLTHQGHSVRCHSAVGPVLRTKSSPRFPKAADSFCYNLRRLQRLAHLHSPGSMDNFVLDHRAMTRKTRRCGMMAWWMAESECRSSTPVHELLSSKCGIGRGTSRQFAQPQRGSDVRCALLMASTAADVRSSSSFQRPLLIQLRGVPSTPYPGSTRSRAVMSTGFTRWRLKPADCVHRRSSDGCV